ncbi:hypothetical protein BKA93DRAFT_753585 [Sparassis latifolia]
MHTIHALKVTFSASCEMKMKASRFWMAQKMHNLMSKMPKGKYDLIDQEDHMLVLYNVNHPEGIPLVLYEEKGSLPKVIDLPELRKMISQIRKYVFGSKSIYAVESDGHEHTTMIWNES